LFIALANLFQYCIIIPSLKKAGVDPQLNTVLFVLLVMASLSIAAAGYIINDYFDLNIDASINRKNWWLKKLLNDAGRYSGTLYYLELEFC
jgi:4-hydroxybenzoate polyprenyltransferase